MKKLVAVLLIIISIFILSDHIRFEYWQRYSTVHIVNNSIQISELIRLGKSCEMTCPADSTLEPVERSCGNPPEIIKISLFLYIAKFHYLCKVQDISHSLSHLFMLSALKYIWGLVLLVLIFLV